MFAFLSDSFMLSRSGAFNIQRWRELDTSRDRPRLCGFMEYQLSYSYTSYTIRCIHCDHLSPLFTCPHNLSVTHIRPFTYLNIYLPNKQTIYQSSHTQTCANSHPIICTQRGILFLALIFFFSPFFLFPFICFPFVSFLDPLYIFTRALFIFLFFSHCTIPSNSMHMSFPSLLLLKFLPSITPFLLPLSVTLPLSTFLFFLPLSVVHTS